MMRTSIYRRKIQHCVVTVSSSRMNSFDYDIYQVLQYDYCCIPSTALYVVRVRVRSRLLLFTLLPSLTYEYTTHHSAVNRVSCCAKQRCRQCYVQKNGSKKKSSCVRYVQYVYIIVYVVDPKKAAAAATRPRSQYREGTRTAVVYHPV